MIKMSEPSSNSELIAAQNGSWGMFYSFPARLLSYIGAIAISAALFVFPSAIADSAENINHSILTMILVSTSAGFIHGTGFVPRTLLWKLLFSPLFAWPALLFSLIYILF